MNILETNMGGLTILQPIKTGIGNEANWQATCISTRRREGLVPRLCGNEDRGYRYRFQRQM